MTSAFSSNDAAVIEQSVDLEIDWPNSGEINLASFWDDVQMRRCVVWIKENGLQKVCLQFPDALLPFSTSVSEQLQQEVPSVGIFILGDTSYGSCCVDEIAASHIGADGIIHFGHACLSRSVRLPILYVFFQAQLDVNQLVKEIQKEISEQEQKLALFYDVSFSHCVNKIEHGLKDTFTNLKLGRLEVSGKRTGILCWETSDEENYDNTLCIYIGLDNQSFFNTSNSISAKQWYRFDPQSNSLEQTTPLDSKWLRRRFYYIEKCKDASSLGIVVATLTAEGYLDVVNRIQQLAKARGVRTYIISVGKINPAKLANFMEIDCFVLVGCPENNIFNSRDFFKPLVTVFECELALNPAWTGQYPSTYSVNFSEILPSGRLHKVCENESGDGESTDVSLVTGKVRNVMRKEVEEVNGGSTCTEIQLRGKNEVAQISSGDVFQNRTWQGLEQNLGRDSPALLEQGRSGIPIKYVNDPSER